MKNEFNMLVRLKIDHLTRDIGNRASAVLELIEILDGADETTRAQIKQKLFDERTNAKRHRGIGFGAG